MGDFRLRRAAAVITALAMVSCGGGNGDDDATCREGADIPTPVVSSGDEEVEPLLATASVCDGDFGVAHGQGEAFYGERPILHASGDITITVPERFEVVATGVGEFVHQGDGVHVAPLPPEGCHRLGIVVLDPGTDNFSDFAIAILAGDVECTPPPLIES